MAVLHRRVFLAGLVGAALLQRAGAAAATGVELVVLSSGGFTPAFRALAPAYTAMTGNTTRLVLGAFRMDAARAGAGKMARRFMSTPTCYRSPSLCLARGVRNCHP